MKTTWSDWIASRTMKFNAMMMAATSAAIAYAATLTEADLQAFGLSAKNIVLILGAIRIVGDGFNMWLRTDTKQSLVGRSAKNGDTDGIQDAM